MSDFSLPKMNCARVRATSVLPTPVGPRNRNDADRTVRVLQAGTRAANRAGQGADRPVLRDDALVQLFLHAQQLLRLFFLDRGNGNAGPARDNVFDVFARDHAGRGLIEVVLLAQGAKVLALLALLVGVEASLLEFVVRDGVFHAVHDELDALLDLGDAPREARSGAALRGRRLRR